MILGIGIDSVDIHRFDEWHHFSATRLQRIFSINEINYILQNDQQRAERFAARFAAREAFYKALSSWHHNVQIPFFSVCRAVNVTHNKHGAPSLLINWQAINEHLCLLSLDTVPTIHLSLTHTTSIATAMVVIEKVTHL